MRRKPYDFFTAPPARSPPPTEEPPMNLPPLAPPGVGQPAIPPQDATARKVAEGFEASFLAEMLKYTGLNAQPDSFGGGAGEAAFGGLLTEEYARLLAARGGVGLAERIFDVIKHRESGA
jgi:Rod binding domain-containing protein